MSGKPQKVGCRASGRKTSYREFDDLCKVGFFHARLEICLPYALKVKRVDSLSKRGTSFVRLPREITPLV